MSEKFTREYVLQRIHDIFQDLAEEVANSDMDADTTHGAGVELIWAEMHLQAAWDEYVTAHQEKFVSPSVDN